ncbi:MAG: hypothetical protein HFE73_07740 [Firmicutes bacterium]|nr:hypothetical protein [Bacillota bacterium]
MKKILSLLLTVCLLLCMFPMTVFADTTDVEGSGTAADKVVTKLEITTPPTKTKYIAGEKFDPAGMVVKATFEGDEVDEAYTGYTIENADAELTVDATAVTVKAGDQSATVAIEVFATKEVASIEVDTKDAKTEYVIGDEADWSGLVVKAVYNDDTKGQPLTASEYEVTGFDSSVANESVQITVTATIEEQDYTAMFNVKINKKALTKEDFEQNIPDDVTFGDEFEVTVTSKDAEKTGDVTVKYAPQGEETATETKPTDAGTYDVIASADGSEKYAAADVKVGQLVIKPMTIHIFGAETTAKKYDGNTAVDIAAVTFKKGVFVEGEEGEAVTIDAADYEAVGVLEDADVGTNKKVTVTVTLKNTNYALEKNTFEALVNVTKGDAPTTAKADPVLAKAGVASTVTAKIIGMPTDAGAKTFKVETATDANSILGEVTVDENGVLTISVLETGAKDNTATIPVTITSARYEDATANVVVTLTDKNIPVVTCDNIEKVFDDKAVDIEKDGKATATFGEGEDAAKVEGTWTFKDGAEVKNVADSGDLTIVFTPAQVESVEVYAAVEMTITVTITKAPTTTDVTVTPITEAGKTLADATITAKDNSVAGTVEWDDPEDTVVTQGTSYGWTFTPADADNYEVVTGKAIPWEASSVDNGYYVPAKPPVTEEPDADKEKAELIEKIQGTKFTAQSQMSTAKGKKAVKISWKAEGADVDFDGYDIFRSTKRYSGYTNKPIFSTKKTTYYNTAIKKGVTYYYKVRAYKIVDGEKVYTGWSTKAWRTVK